MDAYTDGDCDHRLFFFVSPPCDFAPYVSILAIVFEGFGVRYRCVPRAVTPEWAYAFGPRHVFRASVADVVLV